jgi:two-component system, NarL family, nitrate/nitrite response regulator NarL
MEVSAIMAARSELIFSGKASTQSSFKLAPRLRTVVVDDSETFLEVTCDLLDMEDVIQIVAAASDGVDAIETITRLKPALVIMDINMPGLDGLTTASLLTEMSPAPAVVLMSMEDSPRLRAAAVKAGAFAFVHKPNFHDEFEAVLNRILQGRDSGNAPDAA